MSTKRLKRLFMLAFCLPLGILGAVPPDNVGEDKKPDDDKSPTGDTPPKDGGADSLPKTQEELDALIEARLARERRKQQKAAPPKDAAPADTPPVQDNPELQTANRELMLARAQLEAVRSGIAPDVAEDAVYLAMREAEKADELDAEGIKAALQVVLGRHPEWKKVDKEKKAGFKVGADSDSKSPGADKALPIGKVIF